MNNFKLLDPRPRAKEAPFTFYLPSEKILKQLKVEDSVKLLFEVPLEVTDGPDAERMWVTITERKRKRFKGLLQNQPGYIAGLNRGDLISFETFHILDTSLTDPKAREMDYYFDTKCLVSNRILEENKKPRFMLCDEADSSRPAFWSFYGGGESEEYCAVPENFRRVSIGVILNMDPRIEKLIRTPPPAVFEIGKSGKWISADDFDWNEYRTS